MEIINYESKNFRKLKKYKLHKKIDNSESFLYVKNNSDTKKELIKIFILNDGSYFENKKSTLEKLYNLKGKAIPDQIVLPNNFISINGKISGYSQDLIENNINLQIILDNPLIPISTKIDLLYKVAILLEKIEKNPLLREHNFYLGDIHSGNFIYDKNSQNIKAIDVDSSTIDANKPGTAKYLCNSINLGNKYSNNKRNYNSTILCYYYMLLSFLANTNISNQPKGFYLRYLKFLKQCGINEELCYYLSLIYTDSDNILKPDLIKTLDDQTLKKVQKKSFYSSFKTF